MHVTVFHDATTLQFHSAGMDPGSGLSEASSGADRNLICSTEVGKGSPALLVAPNARSVRLAETRGSCLVTKALRLLERT